MEEIRARVIDFQKKLNVILTENEKTYYLHGSVSVKARFGDYSISKSYCIRIEIFKPKLNFINSYKILVPKIYVLSGIDYKYQHIYSNGLLCLDSDFIQYDYLLKNGFDYIKWFEHFFYAYAVEYEYHLEFGCSLGMARSHGKEGLLEALLDYIKVPENQRNKLSCDIKKCVSIQDIKNIIKKTKLVDVKKWEINELINDYYSSI